LKVCPKSDRDRKVAFEVVVELSDGLIGMIQTSIAKSLNCSIIP